jgi:hypothetical protein
LLIALVVGIVISVAALVDPFSWLPSLHAIFGSDCHDNYSTKVDECDLARRYPGFWPHVLVNFGFAVVALVLVVLLWRATANLRRARAARFGGTTQVEAYRTARADFALAVIALTALGLVPILVAVL